MRLITFYKIKLYEISKIAYFVIVLIFQRLQNEMNIKKTNMDDIDSLALLLMEKECLNNTTKIQKETEELKSYFTVVLDRVSQYSEKLETTNAQVCIPFFFYLTICKSDIFPQKGTVP